MNIDRYYGLTDSHNRENEFLDNIYRTQTVDDDDGLFLRTNWALHWFHWKKSDIKIDVATSLQQFPFISLCFHKTVIGICDWQQIFEKQAYTISCKCFKIEIPKRTYKIDEIYTVSDEQRRKKNQFRSFMSTKFQCLGNIIDMKRVDHETFTRIQKKCYCSAVDITREQREGWVKR